MGRWNTSADVINNAYRYINDAVLSIQTLLRHRNTKHKSFSRAVEHHTESFSRDWSTVVTTYKFSRSGSRSYRSLIPEHLEEPLWNTPTDWTCHDERNFVKSRGSDGEQLTEFPPPASWLGEGALLLLTNPMMLRRPYKHTSRHWPQ